jgi:hypothetical protein
MNWIDWTEFRRNGEHMRLDLVEENGGYYIQERKGRPDSWSAPAVHDVGNDVTNAQDEMARLLQERQAEGWAR